MTASPIDSSVTCARSRSAKSCGFGLLAPAHNPPRHADAHDDQQRGARTSATSRMICVWRDASPSVVEKPTSSGVRRRLTSSMRARIGPSVAGCASPATMLACSSSASASSSAMYSSAFAQIADRLAHEAHVAKPAEQHDHAVDVVGVVLARDERLRALRRGPVRALQLEARLPVAERDGDRPVDSRGSPPPTGFARSGKGCRPPLSAPSTTGFRRPRTRGSPRRSECSPSPAGPTPPRRREKAM